MGERSGVPKQTRRAPTWPTTVATFGWLHEKSRPRGRDFSCYISPMRLYWLLSALICSFVFAALEYVALADFLYWRYRWLDTPMHLFGGFTVGLFLAGLMSKHSPFLFFSAIAAVGVGWEVFEASLGLPQSSFYLIDTFHDLANDALGALVAHALARRALWR